MAEERSARARSVYNILIFASMRGGYIRLTSVPDFLELYRQMRRKMCCSVRCSLAGTNFSRSYLHDARGFAFVDSRRAALSRDPNLFFDCSIVRLLISFYVFPWERSAPIRRETLSMFQRLLIYSFSRIREVCGRFPCNFMLQRCSWFC